MAKTACPTSAWYPTRKSDIAPRTAERGPPPRMRVIHRWS
jgi:hypothetical protein